MTLGQILDNIKRRLDKYPALQSSDGTHERLIIFVNDAYRELMRIDGVGNELRDETVFSIATTPGTARLLLPPTVMQVSNVTDRTNRVKLVQRSLSWIRQQDPGHTTMGTPYAYTILNSSGINLQPAPPFADVYALSTDPTDMRPFDVEVMLQNGTYFRHQGTLNGTTPVVIPIPPTSGGMFIQQIYRFYMEAEPPNIARVDLIQGTGPTARLLAVIAAGPDTPTGGVMAARGWVLSLYPVPNSAIQYVIDYEKPIYPLVSLTDTPDFPVDFHTLLVWGGCREELAKMDDDRYKLYDAKWNEDIKRLRHYMHHLRGRRLIPDGRTKNRYSDLGPNFPADW